MFECDLCTKETKIIFSWYHSEHLCEDCYFSALGADPTDIPLNDISELPKLSGVYNA